MQDWLDKAQEALCRAREVRDTTSFAPSLLPGYQWGSDGQLLEVQAIVQPANTVALRKNLALEQEVSNVIDASIIAAAQAQAGLTGRREYFYLPDGAMGSVDAEGHLYDEHPPQG